LSEREPAGRTRLDERALPSRLELDSRDVCATRPERGLGAGESRSEDEREEDKAAHGIPGLPLPRSRARATNLR